MGKKSSDFRYNTGETRVPWAAVGENYNAEDLMEVIKFLMQGEGKAHDDAIAAVREAVMKLDKVSTPPGKLSLGDRVDAVEAQVAEYLHTPSSLFLTNCTAGFEIAYKYANIGPGDEVIVPAITFIATMAYPLAAGAKLVFADVDPRTLNMDPADVAKKITPKTKMIVPVDLGGYPVDLDSIMELAHKHDILVLEDAAHSFGALYKGRNVGTIADFTSFSLHEVKNCTSFGEGGILTTTVESFRDYMKGSRFFGADFTRHIPNWVYDVVPMPGKYGPFVAGNASTTEIQAIGLSQQVKRYDKILAERRAAAEYLNKRFAGCDAIVPQLMGDEGTKPSFHMYQLQIDPAKAGGDIQVMKKKLEEKGVTSLQHFGPLYHFDLLKTFGYSKEEIAKTCPVTEEAFNHRFTHLPIYDLDEDQLIYMADAVLESIDEMQRGV
ncbi:MAG: DegT/DnrJ/EryC1/StrS family aminotransferase [Oscillospiraceae bacterium]|nr:DegT/DnrJ/EryC1/StrS family aminotransferase [Oscillospiraceae bacterium]